MFGLAPSHVSSISLQGNQIYLLLCTHNTLTCDVRKPYESTCLEIETYIHCTYNELHRWIYGTVNWFHDIEIVSWNYS